MEFGRIDQLTDVSFLMPEDNPANKFTFSDEQIIHRTIYVGLTGWGEKEWLANIYPRGTKSTSFLSSYARSFNSVELNSTFYGIPSEKVLKKWIVETPDDFRFFPKVWRSISHRSNFGTMDDAFHTYIEMLSHLGYRVQASFLQLPPYFGGARTNELASFISRWPAEHKLFVEFRDREWLDDEPIMDLMQSKGVGLVITDVAGRRDLLHMRVLSNQAFIRFVASGDPSIDTCRLNQWRERLHDWYEKGLEWVAFFCHEPVNKAAPDLARTVSRIFNQTDSFNIPKIKDILNYETTQKSIFEAS
jgi:uncharacterized protein YecE (DUF72 family)